MTADRAHAGTEWQAALPRMEASGGFQMQALPLTCMFIAAPGYPSPGLPGPYISVSLAAKSSSTEAPGKGQAANESRVLRGKRQLPWGPRDWGLAPVLPPLELLASLILPKGHGFLTAERLTCICPLPMRGTLSGVLTLLICSFYFFYAIYIFLRRET